MTEQRAKDLAAEYGRLTLEMERARNQDNLWDCQSCEDKLARIEGEFQRAFLSIDDYRE